MPVRLQRGGEAGARGGRGRRPGARASTRRRVLWLCGAAAALCLLSPALPVVWLGAPTFWVLAGATRVQVFQINPRGAPAGAAPETLVDRHAILAEGRDLGAAGRARLRHVLLAPARYLFGPVNDTACVVSPGVAFRVWRGTASVDVLLCYQCAHVIVATRDARGRVVREYWTAFPVGQLSGLVRGAFPDDPPLQGTLRDFERRALRAAAPPREGAPPDPQRTP